MEYVIENSKIKATINSLGAELVSVIFKEDNTQRLWQAKLEAWKRHAPVLFPLVGKYKNNETYYKGQKYSMSQHGFARDMEFSLISHSDNKIVMELFADDNTKGVYPFDFKLECSYELKDNKIVAGWKVVNTGKNTMHFSIGAHPAFIYPEMESLSGIEISFKAGQNTPHKIDYVLLNSDGVVASDTYELLLNNGKIAVAEDFFDKDALIVEKSGVDSVSLVKDGHEFVTVEFEAPVFGLWSPVKKKVPFICIEPWYGRADSADFTGDLTERVWGNRLEPDKEWVRSYSMIFN